MRKIYIVLIIVLLTVLSVLLSIFDLFLILPVFFCFFPCYWSNRGQRRRIIQEEYNQTQDVNESEQNEGLLSSKEIQKGIIKCPICGNLINKQNLRYCEFCGSKL